MANLRPADFLTLLHPVNSRIPWNRCDPKSGRVFPDLPKESPIKLADLTYV